MDAPDANPDGDRPGGVAVDGREGDSLRESASRTDWPSRRQDGEAFRSVPTAASRLISPGMKPSPPGSGLPERRRLRLRCWDYDAPGYYFVTICTAGRRPLLATISGTNSLPTPIGRLVLDTLEHMERHVERLRWLETVLMPDHLHLLLELTPDPGPGLPALMRRLKATTARAINRLAGRKGPVWHRSYMDRVVRSLEEAEAIAFYIRDNPARWAARHASALSPPDDPNDA
ncbi:MAG: hypothetical protein D6738_02780 [Acidobacteria bacterium]|nr:MAG: hypothetical protein D6738_02780 [Acidobacteriota bacterium]